MTKPAPSTATEDAAPLLAPMQEGLDRLHMASENLSATCVDIANHQFLFLQRTVFDTLTELQGLSRARNPTEFVQATTEFAWRCAERSIQALTDFGNDVGACWTDALKDLPAQAVKAPKSRAVH